MSDTYCIDEMDLLALPDSEAYVRLSNAEQIISNPLYFEQASHHVSLLSSMLHPKPNTSKSGLSSSTNASLLLSSIVSTSPLLLSLQLSPMPSDPRPNHIPDECLSEYHRRDVALITLNETILAATTFKPILTKN